MPEIGEVARVVHFLHKHIVGKTLAVVKAQHDENVFGKVGTSAAEFEKALTGKKVVGARQQGKYFWMEMASPPHPLMHFGMSGWFKIRNETTAYLKSTNDDSDDWPPKYWKFRLETAEEPKCEAAFVDSRRFARIRLIDCEASELRQISPLKENGPDPVIDKDLVTEEWLTELLGRKRIPVKALLLDQGNISGIGNWVGDEIMYNARMHPEQYSNTLSAAQISQLHKSIHYVCGLAVETLADSSKFPEEWLFKHRWTKGKKDAPTTLPNGSKFVFLTVGGRTSAVVPSVQKKTGPVKQDVDENGKADGEDAEKTEPKSTTKKGAKRKKVTGAVDGGTDTEQADIKPAAPKSKSKNSSTKVTKESDHEEAVVVAHEDRDDGSVKQDRKKQKTTAKPLSNDVSAPSKQKKKGTDKSTKDEPSRRRRSGRISDQGAS